MKNIGCAPAVCAAMALVLCLVVACDGDNKTLPTGPDNSCTLAPPVSASPQVVASGCDSVNCTASFTVQTPTSLGRVLWSFPGGQPAESSNATGAVTYPRPSSFPATRQWTVTLCACPPDHDASGASCRGTNGTVSWSSGAFGSTIFP